MSAEPIAASLLPDTAEITANDVLIGGVSLRGLAGAYGTPLFVYDEETLRARCREAAGAFDDGVAFASKSFLCGAMARLAFEEGLCIDVATGGELDLVLRSGVPAGRVIMHGNNKSAEELERAIAVGVHRLVVDNFEEIALLSTLVSASAPLNCLVRVTPGVEAHTHEFVRTGQEDTKFGFSVATGDARRAIDELRVIPGLTLHGVHAHIGSQVFELIGFVESLHDPGEVHRRGRLRRTLRRRRAWACPTSPGRRRRRSTSGATRFASPPTRSDSTPTCDCSPNRAAPSSPRRRVTLYEVGRGEARRAAYLHGGRRGNERQPATGALRLGLRGLRRRRIRSPSDPRTCDSSASTARVATS